ncbi:hypothetical protein B566_EDAN007309 [Ephemera danica]|nr:hypothetical protein B566_EDAN007309 [Ephemera danica]
MFSVMYQGCNLVSWFGDMVTNEALHIPRYTVGNIGSPMLYCCLLQFLKLAIPFTGCLQQIGHTNMFVNIMRNSCEIIKNRTNLMCADIAMNVLVTASKTPILVKFLMINELQELFVALTSCKYDVDWKKGVEWEAVYDQGLVLCGNVMAAEPAIAVKYVMHFVIEHQRYLLSLLKLLHNRMDHKGLLIALHSSKLFNRMCDSKTTWEYNSELSVPDIMSAHLICLDLCILFLTRPKIHISSYPEKPAKPDDFKHPSEKFNLLLAIAKECLDCLSKLTSPNMTQLQQFTMLPDSRLQKLVVQVQLTPTPSLARDYKPAPSFGHLNSLSQYCLQIILKKQRDKNALARESSEAEAGVNAAIAYKTLNSCIEFTFLQGKAFIQNCNEPPHVIAIFRKELMHELNYLLDGVRRKQLLTQAQAGDSDPNVTSEVDLTMARSLSLSTVLQF